MKIGIVILNYLAYQVTIDTVNSFLEQDASNVEVQYIIVDNGSTNESYDKLLDIFGKYENIHIYKTEKNLGFANGNNFGYKKLLDHMKPDYVIISNDDILLPQPGIFKWIDECYRKYKFSVLGPDVYSLNGKFHQSPVENYSRSVKKCIYDYLRNCYRILKLRIKQLLKVEVKYEHPSWNNEKFSEPSDKYTLHGSFQIFSGIYFEKYELPYDEATFLYMEEDFLKLRCEKYRLLMQYDNSYTVNHLQAVSTNLIADTNYKKHIFRFKNLNKSLIKYTIKLLKK